MGKQFTVFLFIFSIFAAELKADSVLPEDLPVVPKVVHSLPYLIEGSIFAEIGYSYLYGDKFLSAHGINAQGYYFFSDTFAFSGAVAYYWSSISSEVYQLNLPPQMTNPDLILKAMVLYQPIYGKLAIGSYIQKFFIGFEGGLHVAREVLQGPVFEYWNQWQVPGVRQFKVGPIAAARLYFPFSSNIGASLRGEFLFHSNPLSDFDSSLGARHLWSFGANLSARF